MTQAYLKASVGFRLRFCPFSLCQLWSKTTFCSESAPPLVSSHQGHLNLAQWLTCTMPASTCFSKRALSFAKLRTAWHFLLPSSSELLPLSGTPWICALTRLLCCLPLSFDGLLFVNHFLARQWSGAAVDHSHLSEWKGWAMSRQCHQCSQAVLSHNPTS